MEINVNRDMEAPNKGDSIPFRPKPLQIGNIQVDPPLILAHMAGITDPPYRRLMEKHGAGLVTTEMISVEGLRRDHPASWKLFSPNPLSSVPLSVQLFGSNPEAMVEAAERVEQKGAALIDINAGCPVRKVARQGAGASLLKEPDHLAFLINKIKKAIEIPLTVKVRLGWDSQSINIVDVAKRLSSAGVDAITIHARTAVQFYRGEADWSWIRKAKEALDIPVIGNGDITSPFLANEMFDQTLCDAIMLGRATMGNPWLLSAIVSQWGFSSPHNPQFDWDDFYDTVHEHLQAFQEQRPRSPGHFRKLLVWYSKGCPGASQLRGRLMELDQPETMLCIFQEWTQRLRDRGIPFFSVKVPEVATVSHN